LIVVAGTKRSGTSLWMQLLSSAGYQFIGTKFPRNWEEKLRSANPRGFYESEFRNGIYHETNPHPQTGRYLHPSVAKKLLVKVFIPGVVRSDVAFLDRVVATVRPWREVLRSSRKMRGLEADVFGWGQGSTVGPRYFPADSEWLRENFMLARDLRLRQYPHKLIPHAHLLAQPREVLGEVLEFLGGPMDALPVMSEQVDPTLHRNKVSDIETVLDDDVIALVDTWMEQVHEGRWSDLQGLKALNEAWKLSLQRGYYKEKFLWSDPRVRGTSPSAAPDAPTA
jgi:hypothetical protein